MPADRGVLAVAGGRNDPNLRALLRAAERCGREVLPLLVDPDRPPQVSCEWASRRLLVDGSEVVADACFIRADVFGSNGHVHGHAASAWFRLLEGWVADLPSVHVPNRARRTAAENKMYVLSCARDVGLLVPTTLITNDVVELRRLPMDLYVAKPLTGGGVCMDLVEASSANNACRTAPAPAIVQQRIDGPDVRIYCVGPRQFGFSVRSSCLDYRTDRSPRIERVRDIQGDVAAALQQLLTRFGMDWAAADFKLESSTGRMYFLELNSNPMFSRFDGDDLTISSALLDFL